MKAAVWHGPRDLRVEEIAEPDVGPGEVLLEVSRNGICGSDLHTLSGRRRHAARPRRGPRPRVRGTVRAVGDGVDDLAMGNAVAVRRSSGAACARRADGARRTSAAGSRSTAGTGCRCTGAWRRWSRSRGAPRPGARRARGGRGRAHRAARRRGPRGAARAERTRRRGRRAGRGPDRGRGAAVGGRGGHVGRDRVGAVGRASHARRAPGRHRRARSSRGRPACGGP